MEHSIKVPQKTKNELPSDPVILLPVIYPKERKSVYQGGNCIPIFVVALFTTAKIWKQCKCPSTDKWIKKMWYIYTMEYYSVTKNNEILSLEATCLELEDIMLSEISQAQKDKLLMFSHICGS